MNFQPPDDHDPRDEDDHLQEAARLCPPAALWALSGRYGEVLAPFVVMMERELRANAGKGDRPGWLGMSRETALLELYYHMAKLQKASKDQDAARIVEHSADVANMSMMLLDVCVGMEEAKFLTNSQAVSV